MRTAIALAAAFAIATAAAAEETRTTPYQFNLDLAGADTPEGAARIYSDIRRQAARVCSPLLSQDHMLTKAARACREEVIAEAVRTADRPLVTEAHQRGQDDRRYAAQ